MIKQIKSLFASAIVTAIALGVGWGLAVFAGVLIQVL
jgi:hypothetical protein